MSIKIRPKESPCILSYHKTDWLTFLCFLHEFKDQGADTAIEELLKELISIVRTFVLGKPKEDIALDLTKLEALNLYIHIQDFIRSTGENQKTLLEGICSKISCYLVNGGSNEAS